MPVISISNAQRKALPFANWIGNVYHGLPENQLKTGGGKGKYFAFLAEFALKSVSIARSKSQLKSASH